MGVTLSVSNKLNQINKQINFDTAGVTWTGAGEGEATGAGTDFGVEVEVEVVEVEVVEWEREGEDEGEGVADGVEAPDTGAAPIW